MINVQRLCVLHYEPLIYIADLYINILMIRVEPEDEETTLRKQQKQQQSNNLQTKSRNHSKIVLIFTFILFIWTASLNLDFYLKILTQEQIVKTQNQNQTHSETSQIKETNKISQDLLSGIVFQSNYQHNNQRSIININQLKKISQKPIQPTLSETTKRRISLGPPSPLANNLHIATYRKTIQNSQNNLCLLINGVDLITNITINTGIAMFSDTSYSKWILILDADDKLAEQMLNQLFVRYGARLGAQMQINNVTVDGEYRWIRKVGKGCDNLVYGQHYFKISQSQFNQIPTIISAHENQVLFSKIVKKKQKTTQLEDLTEIDLEWVPQKSLNNYLFIFPTFYLQHITPLNFAFYARYTINQLIIRPILSIVQGSEKLEGFRQLLHSIQSQYGNGKYFALEQIKSNNQIQGPKQEFCFVSYPSQPHQIDFSEFQKYFQSLSKVDGVIHSTIIINMPYKFQSKSNILYKSFQIIMNSKLSVRYRVRSNKTVSSLSCYEAAYTYCKSPSLMISSRHNIQFKPNFIEQLSKKTRVQAHYYQPGFISAEDNEVRIQINSGNYRRLRQNELHYKEYFMHLQVFRMDLFKMMYFWILKCEEIDFYETQASFVLPLLEMVKLSVLVIQMPLFSISKARMMSKLQKQQLESLKLYLQWTPIPNGKLLPYAKNSLQNQAFKKYAPDKIPKKLHQVWLGKKQVTPFQQKLHQTLIDTNSDFTMHLWRDEDITIQNFPLTYSLIRRSIEYQRYSNRSYSAPTVSLIRYELLYRNGGIYIDFKTEGKKNLSPFLRYSLFFIDVDYEQNHYIQPLNVGNGIIGAQINCYQLLLTLTEIISEEKFDFRVFDFPKIVGGFALRKALTEVDLFQGIGYGFQLFSQKPGTGKPNLCSTHNSDPKQGGEIFSVNDHQTGKLFTISIPCEIYKQSYLIMYKVLAGTWKVKKTNVRRPVNNNK